MGENSKKMEFVFKKLPGQKDPTGSDPEGGDDDDDEVEVEVELNLNLGLSLGGRFGVDRNKVGLVRSSSIAAILPPVSSEKTGSGQGFGSGHGTGSGLARTASLPVETEEEWRKRKELQGLRRLAAKRRRSEKNKSLSKAEREEYVAAMGRVGSSVGPGFGSGNWDFGVGGGGGEKSDGGSVPGSVESQASTVSEFESRGVRGSSTEGEVSPASVQSSQERSNQDGSSSSRSKVVDPVAPPSKPKTENPTNNKGKEIRSNTFDMPCVFTQGDGPSGRRIEGILYKYGKGEEVKIMCVCHGSFLSPAEFVMHAGGTDVVHPLKHIVVNPNSSTYL